MPLENVSKFFGSNEKRRVAIVIAVGSLGVNMADIQLRQVGGDAHSIIIQNGYTHEEIVGSFGVINIVFSYLWPSSLTYALDTVLSDGSNKNENS